MSFILLLLLYIIRPHIYRCNENAVGSYCFHKMLSVADCCLSHFLLTIPLVHWTRLLLLDLTLSTRESRWSLRSTIDRFFPMFLLSRCLELSVFFLPLVVSLQFQCPTQWLWNRAVYFSTLLFSLIIITITQYNFVAKCTRNVLWYQVHSSYIHANQKIENWTRLQ